MIGILWTIELVIAIRAGGCNWLPVGVIPLALLAFRFSGLTITKGISVGLIFLCIAASIARNGSTPQRVSQYYTPSNLAAFRIIRQLTALPDVYSSRVAFRDSALAPGNWAMDASFYGLRSFYMNMTPVPHDQFLDMNRESLPNYRELMGARYLVCGKAAPPRSANDRLLFSDGDYRVYELDRWMPTAILVHNLAGSYSGREQFFEKIRRGYDFNRTAYVPAANYDRVNAFMHREYEGATIPDSLKITKRSANERVFRSQTSTPALLILNEYYNKAWHVRVNDRKESLLRVNLNQLGLLLRPGDNIVRFEYKPILFEWLLLTQRALAVVLALFAGIRGYLFF
jgi:hypothetical protein